MITSEMTDRLLQAFPDSFINPRNEFIAHRDSNSYFRLEDCESELDVKCKVLEWLSRAAFKTLPYRTPRKNWKFHCFMLDGINSFLGTEFSEQDIELIYQRLGNRVRHELTVKFVESGYDMSLLEGGNDNATD